MKIEGSVFLVTGGTSGLGAATVRFLAARGAKVMAVDLRDTGAQPLIDEFGAAVRFVRADVSVEADAEAAVQATVAAFGSLHGLVNCAGVGVGERILNKDLQVHTLKGFNFCMQVNVVGTFNFVRYAAQQMAQQAPNDEMERGVIINTASIAAFDGQIGQVAYATSKAAIAGMTLPLARDLSRHGIRVVAIAPGMFETPMMDGVPDEIRDNLARSVPFPPRFGRPPEFAQMVGQIVENVMLNGETIRLDGAVRMPPR